MRYFRNRYLLVWFGCVAVAMAVNMLVVSTVDPKGYLCIYESPALNQNRYYAVSDRFSRSVRLKYGDFNTIYFGSSRTKTGLPTDSEWFKDDSIYNAGILATNMYELKEIIDFSLKYQNPDTVIYAVDFENFTSRRKTNADYDSSLIASEWNLIPALARYLLSFDSFIAAYKTIRANLRGNPPSDTADMNNCDGTRTVLRIQNQREIFTAGIAQMFKSNGIYNCYDYSADRIARFRESLIALLRSGASVALYIPPVHAFQILGVESAGLLPTFNQWRHDISAIVAEIRQDPELSDRLIAAWDFSMPVGVNTEALPSRPDEIMAGYYDSGHHNELIGISVINSLMENRRADDDLYGYQLGIESSSGNIDLLHKQLDQYKDKYPHIVADVDEVRSNYRMNVACDRYL